MREVDVPSLVTGMLSLALAAGYGLHDLGVVELSAAWLLPLALVGVGVAGLTRALLRARPAAATQEDPDPGANSGT